MPSKLQINLVVEVGFSDFDRSNATWQEDQVLEYLKLGDQLPPSWDFHSKWSCNTRRVSALGELFGY